MSASDRSESDSDLHASIGWQSLFRLLKIALFLAVLGFVGHRVQELFSEEVWTDVSLNWFTLVISGCCYAIGWLPAIWFWHRLLQRHQSKISWRTTIAAYYCSHLGKYIPGKASVLLIRGAMVRDGGGRFLSGVITGTFETLFVMGVGFTVAVALIPFFIMKEQIPLSFRWVEAHPLLFSVLWVAMVAISLPLTSRLLSWIVKKTTPSSIDELAETSIPGGNGGEFQITTPFLIQAFFVCLGCWLCHGLSLTALWIGLSHQVPAWEEVLVFTGSVALATTGGFIALFAPAGLGVREGILLELLARQPFLSTQQSILLAFLLRTVWFLTEILMALMLYFILKTSQSNRSQSSTVWF